MSKHEEILKQLQGLREAVPELKAVLLATNEGLPVAHSFANGTDAQRAAAMAAAASGLGRRITETLNAGSMSDISVTGAEGQVFVYAAGSKAVLAVLAPPGSNAGLIHLEARETAARIGGML